MLPYGQARLSWKVIRQANQANGSVRPLVAWKLVADRALTMHAHVGRLMHLLQASGTACDQREPTPPLHAATESVAAIASITPCYTLLLLQHLEAALPHVLVIKVTVL
jgi:hypothetical protein